MPLSPAKILYAATLRGVYRLRLTDPWPAAPAASAACGSRRRRCRDQTAPPPPQDGGFALVPQLSTTIGATDFVPL